MKIEKILKMVEASSKLDKMLGVNEAKCLIFTYRYSNCPIRMDHNEFISLSTFKTYLKKHRMEKILNFNFEESELHPCEYVALEDSSYYFEIGKKNI